MDEQSFILGSVYPQFISGSISSFPSVREPIGASSEVGYLHIYFVVLVMNFYSNIYVVWNCSQRRSKTHLGKRDWRGQRCS